MATKQKQECPFRSLDRFSHERDYEDAFSHKSGHYTRDLDSVTFAWGDGAEDQIFTITGISNAQADWIEDALNKKAKA